MPGSTLKRVVVAGGSGLVGRPLVRALAAAGTEVAVLSRSPKSLDLPWGATGYEWEHLANLLEGADAVINLAGEGIAEGRWTAARKQILLDSRIQTTDRLVQAMAKCRRPPVALVNASAIGWYIPRDEVPVDESCPSGPGFLAEVCQAWEAAALKASELGVRVARVRIGVVLAREGGALPKMVLPVRFYQACKLGSCTQGLSWIHLDDLVAMLVEAARNPAWDGAFNGTAPEPLSNEAFTRLIAHRLGRPMLPIPGFLTAAALRLFLGELAQALLLQGAFVRPVHALKLNFPFRFPTAQAALEDLL